MAERFLPTWESLRTHRVPNWFHEAKFGIFIHWGPYSVPAFAPPQGELGAVPEDYWFTHNPYAEWYFNSVNVGEGPTYEHHLKTYGADFPYERFVDMWQAEAWQPEDWASLFQEAGARYVVLVTKHHDGFCLFPSRHTAYTTVNRGPKRDIVGELTKSVKDRGMRMGLYYSSIIDWTYMSEPMRTDADCRLLNSPTHAYADYVFNQYYELIDAYKPSVLWSDIGWPYAAEHMLPHVLSHFYNACPDGVVNDRFNGLFHDYKVKEYHQGQVARDEKWEYIRGMGLSFGYNAMEDARHTLPPDALVRELVGVVSENGNLLINIGPRADGSIPEIQAQNLRAMGKWLARNGEGIYATNTSTRRPVEQEGAWARFTQKDGDLYAFVDFREPGSLNLPGLDENYSFLDVEAGQQLNVMPGPDGLLIKASEATPYPVGLRFPGRA